MKLGQEIESIRKNCGFSVVDICNAMGIEEPEYNHIVHGKQKPTTYQLIMFISLTRKPLATIKL